MRTKTLLLSAALGAVGIAAASAQVYSVNVVGYTSIAIPSGLSMIANQLNTTNNTIGALLPTVPNFSNLYKWNGSTFTIATYLFGNWDQPTLTLNPGEGAFIATSTAFTNVFVGEVLQGSLTNTIPTGLSIRSSIVPQAGTATSLGLTANLANFDNLYKWDANAQAYVIYTLLFGNWSPSEPSINVGESVFLSSSAGGNWVRNFTVQ